jgi:hypothetical protein
MINSNKQQHRNSSKYTTIVKRYKSTESKSRVQIKALRQHEKSTCPLTNHHTKYKIQNTIQEIKSINILNVTVFLYQIRN